MIFICISVGCVWLKSMLPGCVSLICMVVLKMTGSCAFIEFVCPYLHIHKSQSTLSKSNTSFFQKIIDDKIDLKFSKKQAFDVWIKSAGFMMLVCIWEGYRIQATSEIPECSLIDKSQTPWSQDVWLGCAICFKPVRIALFIFFVCLLAYALIGLQMELLVSFSWFSLFFFLHLWMTFFFFLQKWVHFEMFTF